MTKRICNLGSNHCLLCGHSWEGDFKPSSCPNKGRKILDVAFEYMKPAVDEANKKYKRIKSIDINFDDLLKETLK